MKWFPSGVFRIAWALWLGGTVAILLLVQQLFRNDRELAILAAPKLFLVFERYQLVLAAVALVSLAGLGRRRWAALLPLVLIAAAAAVVSAVVVTPRIEHLRLAGQQHTPAFRTTHGLSMLIYLAQVVTLLAAGMIVAHPIEQSVDVPEESDRHHEL
jgi:hypothetical protein